MMKYQPVNHNFIPKDDKIKETSIKQETSIKKEPIPKKEEIIVPVQALKVEENILMNNEVDYLREQLNHSEFQLSTLEIRLQDYSSKISILEEELRNYEILKNDMENISSLNANISKLKTENNALKQELKQQKDHVQMLYLVLLILAIL